MQEKALWSWYSESVIFSFWQSSERNVLENFMKKLAGYMCEISGLLQQCAQQISIYLLKIQDNPLVPIYKVQAVQKKKKCIFLRVQSLQKLRPIGFPQTLVTKYQSTLCNIPEGRRTHLHPGGNLKSGFMCVFWWLSVVEEGCIYIRISSSKMYRTPKLEAFMKSILEKTFYLLSNTKFCF